MTDIFGKDSWVGPWKSRAYELVGKTVCGINSIMYIGEHNERNILVGYSRSSDETDLTDCGIVMVIDFKKHHIIYNYTYIAKKKSRVYLKSYTITKSFSSRSRPRSYSRRILVDFLRANSETVTALLLPAPTVAELLIELLNSCKA